MTQQKLPLNQNPQFPASALTQVQPHQLAGVQVCALSPDGPVQVRAGDAAGGAALPNPVACRHALALPEPCKTPRTLLDTGFSPLRSTK